MITIVLLTLKPVVIFMRREEEGGNVWPIRTEFNGKRGWGTIYVMLIYVYIYYVCNVDICIYISIYVMLIQRGA